MSNLRHWRARTTSATSSSTSATRRVAVAEELLRDLSKARLASARSVAASSSCSMQSLFHLRDASAVGRGMSPRLPVRPLPRWRQARRIALQIHALRRCAESTSGRHICALSGGPAVLASCPADRLDTILASAAACTLLRVREARHGSRLRRRSSSGPHVGCSGALCLHSGSCTFYMLLTLSYMDPLGDFLGDCRTQTRAFALMVAAAAQQIACTPSWPPLLPALSCACARRAMVLVSGDGRAAAVLCACILVPAHFTCS